MPIFELRGNKLFQGTLEITENTLDDAISNMELLAMGGVFDNLEKQRNKYMRASGVIPEDLRPELDGMKKIKDDYDKVKSK